MFKIDREKARSLIEDDPKTAVIEVLPREYFEKFHLPGARNVPLNDAFPRRIQELVPDKSQPVLVYCLDEECDASPKAAGKLEELGYQDVYVYEAGKMDWREAGLPVES